MYIDKANKTKSDKSHCAIQHSMRKGNPHEFYIAISILSILAFNVKHLTVLAEFPNDCAILWHNLRTYDSFAHMADL